MIRLIGLLGAKGCGKDTLAKQLIERFGYVRIGFADALYREVANAFGVTVEYLENRQTKETPLPGLRLSQCKDAGFVEIALRTLNKQRGLIGTLFGSLLRKKDLDAPRSPRWIMQLWGTEFRRNSRHGWDSYWIDQVKAVLLNAPSQSRYVITDVRFVNEAKMIGERSGMLIRVRRRLLEEQEAAARARGAGTALHPSETELLSYPVDLEAFNQEGQPSAMIEGVLTHHPGLAQAA